ncbi:MAG: cytochrome c oxidase subunit II [Planctomycetales bacterium]|nr:cytochrome c oxidase subunit II [Planctomycetales bacterium]
MGRFWSLLFLAVPVLGVGVFAAAMMTDSWPLHNHWLPRDVSEKGYVIDNLFNTILYLTGVIFVGTSLALFWFLWKYDGEKNLGPVRFLHGSHTLEVVWSIIPAATLLFIAIYQMNAWADAKIDRPGTRLAGADGRMNTEDDLVEFQLPIAQVTGRQFEWRIRYAGRDGVVGTSDDVHTVNDLHLPVDEEVVLQIKSDDVLHSFFLPNCRLKQDVVPGMKQMVWFKPKEVGSFDIVCAELCGWGHYKMKGRMTIQSRKDFDQWLTDQERIQQESSFALSEEE